MNKKIIILGFLVVSLQGMAQLVVNNAPPYNTATNLVQNVLLGTGVTASNFMYTGAPEGIGFFDGVNSNLGLDSGIVLCSGDILNAVGPNNIGSQTFSAGTPGNPLLDNLIPGFSTNDAAMLQFDFVPSADTIKFNYVFGSEEYMEWVNSSFNDVFGFFVSGPNPAGGFYNQQNIALIPGTTMPVTIDNVNGFVNNQYYFNNESPPGQTVQYDGFTTVLTAILPVECNETYTIVIGVADAGDTAYDSGVFLQASSFSSSGPSVGAASQSQFTFNDTTLIEGCDDALLYISLPEIAQNDTTIYLTYPLLHPNSAINGVDYLQLPDSVIIAAGDSAITLTIQAMYDTEIEGDEIIDVVIPINSPCTSITEVGISFLIIDVEELNVESIPDTVICPDEEVTLEINATGGFEFYDTTGTLLTSLSYSWSTGDTTTSIQETPQNSTTYYYTVYDACAIQTFLDSVFVDVYTFSPVDVFIIEPVDLVCLDEIETVVIDTSGGLYNKLTWTFGSDINSVAFPEYDIFGATPGFYDLLIEIEDVCGNIDSESLLIEVVECDVDTPNVFTPNGDGTFDYLYFDNLEYHENAVLNVYNRWGHKVYSSEQYETCTPNNLNSNFCWDGTNSFTGGKCAEGVYFYILTWDQEGVPKEETIKNSFVHLFR